MIDPDYAAIRRDLELLIRSDTTILDGWLQRELLKRS